MYACTVVFLQNWETSTPHCSWQTLRGINWHIKKLSVPRTALRTRRRRPACSDIVCIISSKSYYARAALYGKCPKAQSPIGIRIYVDVLHLQFGSIRFNHNSIINHISLLSFAFLYILVFSAEPWTYSIYIYGIYIHIYTIYIYAIYTRSSTKLQWALYAKCAVHFHICFVPLKLLGTSNATNLIGLKCT